MTQNETEVYNELYKRLLVYLQNYKKWTPLTYEALETIPLTDLYMKMFNYDPQRTTNAIMEVLNKLPPKKGFMNTINNFLGDSKINRLKNDESWVEIANNILDVAFRESYNYIDENTQSPFEKPLGVSNIYLEDLAPNMQLALNKAFGNYTGEFSPQYSRSLRQKTVQNLHEFSDVLDKMVDYTKDPKTFYNFVHDNSEVQELMKILSPQLQIRFNEIYKKGEWQSIVNKNAGVGNTELNDELKFMERIDTINKPLEIDYQGDVCPVDGPSPNDLLEYCQDLADQKQIVLDSDTTNTLWSKIKPYAFAGIGVAGLGVGGYAAYKYWQSKKQQEELQKQLEEEAKLNRLKQQHYQEQLKQARKQKPMIINNLRDNLPQHYNEESIWG